MSLVHALFALGSWLWKPFLTFVIFLLPPLPLYPSHFISPFALGHGLLASLQILVEVQLETSVCPCCLC